MGVPLGPSILGTPNAFFTVDVIINNVVNASMLTLIQFALVYPTEKFVLVPGVPYNATEGNFMSNPTWAQEGTDFFTNYGGIDGSGYETQYVIIALNPNNATGNFDWGSFPDTTGLPESQRVICTFEFEAIYQDEYPWEQYDSGAFDIEYLFPALPERMFLDGNDEWIPAETPVAGDYYVQGWILGLLLDVYTQYPAPYGGQGINATSDMFTPQATVILFAVLTYNADPVQNKLVTFQIAGGGGTCDDPCNGTKFVNFTRTAVTDENGIAFVSFGIPWPCSPAEAEEIFGVWCIVAKSTVREQVVADWLYFKVNWLTVDLTVTPKDSSVKKGECGNFTVTFNTPLLQNVSVLIVVTIFDDLNVPVATAYLWVNIGDPDTVWCTSKNYTFDFLLCLPKWAFAGEGTVYVDVMTDWPFDCGIPVAPEASATFSIIKYT
jgi:hypothetical protein